MKATFPFWVNSKFLLRHRKGSANLGLSQTFQDSWQIAVYKSKHPFYCTKCRFNKQENEIASLRKTVEDLSRDFQLLSNLVKYRAPSSEIEQPKSAETTNPRIYQDSHEGATHKFYASTVSSTLISQNDQQNVPTQSNVKQYFKSLWYM